MSGQINPSSTDDLLPREQMLSMSGLAFLVGIQDGKYPLPPIAKTLNFWFHEIAFGKVALRGAPEFSGFNLLGGTHGGWYATVLDSSLACAVQSTLPQGSVYTTLELKLNIIRSIPMGMTVEATSQCQHTGRSTGISSGEIRGVEDGRLYATGSTTCFIMTP
ncbi:MAG: PaaI family thioesterase [Pseudoruegeria sp.]